MKKLPIYSGIIAPILFLLIVIVASLLRPGYSHLYNFISDLGVGSYSIIQNFNFILFGILIMAFAISFYDFLPSSHSRSLATYSLILFAMGVFLAGVFPEDYLGGKPHTLVSATAFISIIITQLTTWKALKHVHNYTWYRRYSLLSGLISLILVWFSASPPFPGLMQRLFLAFPLLWIEVTAIEIYKD